MKKLITMCGLNCVDCPAYTATLNNDIALKKQLASEWSNEKCTFEPEEIHCTGCHECNWKMTEACSIRDCCLSKGYRFCSYCSNYPCSKYKANSENLDFIRDAFKLASQSSIAYLTSINEEGTPVTRAMLNMEVNGLDSIWFSTNTPSPKVAQFEKNNRACVYYSDNNNFKGLTLMGTIEILKDDESKQRLWREGFERYYPKGVTDPGYCVLKFTSDWASYYYNGLQEFYL